MQIRVATFIATAGYAGFARNAPGTWGSLVGIILAWPVLALGGLYALLVASIFFYLIGVWAADVYEAHTGRHDPKEIVIDEVVGQWITLLIGVLCFPLYDDLFQLNLIKADYLNAILIQDRFLEKMAHLVVLHPSMLRFAWIGGIVLKISLPAFLMFRLFDIAKPGFIGRIDRMVQGGMGTMLDDALAGVVAGVTLPLLWLLLYCLSVGSYGGA